MDLRIPEVVDPQTLTLSFTIAGYQSLMDEVMRLHSVAETALQGKSVAQGELKTAQEQLETLNTTVQEQSGTIQALTKERETALQQLVTLRSELDAARPLPSSSVRITRTTLPKIYGFTIEKGKAAPSKPLYDQVRGAMRWGGKSGMGFDTWRGFFNPTEVSDHLKPTPPLGHLITYAKSHGLTRWLADTIDTILKMPPSEVDLKAYMKGLEDLDCQGVYVNDADQYSIPVLTEMLTRLRAVAPNMPVFVSLRGSANVTLYKDLVDDKGNKLIDWIEIQTFGTVTDLVKFLMVDDALPFKIVMCLDDRPAMTTQSLAQRAAVILRNPPDQFFYYSDLAQDYEAQTDEEDVVIRGLVAMLKARPA